MRNEATAYVDEGLEIGTSAFLPDVDDVLDLVAPSDEAGVQVGQLEDVSTPDGGGKGDIRGGFGTEGIVERYDRAVRVVAAVLREGPLVARAGVDADETSLVGRNRENGVRAPRCSP